LVSSDTLVSIGLPVRNAGVRLEGVVGSVLGQDHGNVELVISDNASTDATEQVCRDLAATDPRITYHRQPENLGLLNNFLTVIRLARGAYFRWIGDDDRLEPAYVSRCLRLIPADPRLVLVTSQVTYTGPDGEVSTAVYRGTALGSDDPVDRFCEMLRLLNEEHTLIDPLYGLVRRSVAEGIPRRNMVREDEVFALKLALAGPWGHVPEVLAYRSWRPDKIANIARRLGVPAWQAHVSNTLAAREILRALRAAGLTPEQHRRALTAVFRMYLRRQRRTVDHRGRKLLRIATGR
jgi:glycosyltransferase involved in cell wall biosynthesis